MCALLRDTPSHTDSLNTQWIKTPYGLRLADNIEDSFKTLMEQESFVMKVDRYLNGNAQYVARWEQELTKASQDGIENKDNVAEGDLFYSKPNYTDTRVGGNDAINPYWQFNLDDDIVPPILNSKYVEDGVNVGVMGRVYSETYDSNQQILWMCMGVPEYTNLISFYADAGNKNAAAAMNRGTLKSLTGTIINLVYTTAITAITLPVMAPFWASKWLTRIQSDRVTQYFTFKPAMVIYYEMVNTMLSYLAVSMGIYPQVLVRRRDSTKTLKGHYEQMQFQVEPQDTSGDDERAAALQRMNNAKQTADKGYTSGTKEITDPRLKKAQEEADAINNIPSAMGEDEGGKSSYSDTGYFKSDDGLEIGNRVASGDSGIPNVLKHGPDIFAILNRRAEIFKAGRVKVSTRQLLAMTKSGNQDRSDGKYFSTPNDMYVVTETKDVRKLANGDGKKGAWSKCWSSLKSNMFGAGDFVGFRIERGVSCSESISNSTGQLGIAQKLNSYAQEQRQKYEDYGNSWLAKTAGELAKNPETFLKTLTSDLVSKAAGAVGLGDIGAILTQGNGFIDIPEVWTGSSCSRSFTFNINLNARYGDPVSIFQSIYIPMLMLLAAATPRAIGNAMYTSPFLVKAFCKGFFSIPCGLITSLSFTRGKDEYGWSANMLPTCVNVNMTIQDLSPAFFLSMQDIGLFDTFTRNDKLMEYLDTLSALGIYERQHLWPKALRKLSAAILIKKNTLFNSNYWGMRMGKSPMARAIAAVTPFGNYEKEQAEFFQKS